MEHSVGKLTLAAALWETLQEIVIKALIDAGRRRGWEKRACLVFRWLGSRRTYQALRRLRYALYLANGKAGFSISREGAKLLGLSEKQALLAGGVGGVVALASKLVVDRFQWPRSPLRPLPSVFSPKFLLSGLGALVGAYFALRWLSRRSYLQRGNRL